jgi:hypothetical protein
MNILTKVASISILSFVVGCNHMQTNSGLAIIFADVKEPVAFFNGVSSSKTGQACQESFLNLIATGDSSREAAKRNGGITKVATINLEKKNTFFYGKTCTVVTGE